MRPEARLLGIAWELPGEAVANDRLAEDLALEASEITRRTGVERRHYAAAGEGPSELAARAATAALEAARTTASEIGLVIFATATPDVCFPGAACYLQDKLGAGTVGALDVRAQSAGFLCALDLAAAFTAQPGPGGGADARYARVLIAAGEVHSSGLDSTPRGADLTPRFGDGAAVAIVGRDGPGPRVRALRWYTEGDLADRFWCEYPASRQYPLRITAADIEAGRHFPSADLGALGPVVRNRLQGAAAEVLAAGDCSAAEIDLAVCDYVEPSVARAAALDLGCAADRVVVPTEIFGHVMAGGLPIALAQRLSGLRSGAVVLLAAAGPGLTYGAALLEV